MAIQYTNVRIGQRERSEKIAVSFLRISWSPTFHRFDSTLNLNLPIGLYVIAEIPVFFTLITALGASIPARNDRALGVLGSMFQLRVFIFGSAHDHRNILTLELPDCIHSYPR